MARSNGRGQQPTCGRRPNKFRKGTKMGVVVLEHEFGMPLDGEHPRRGGHDDGFDQPVRSEDDRFERWGEIADGLVVKRVDAVGPIGKERERV